MPFYKSIIALFQRKKEEPVKLGQSDKNQSRDIEKFLWFFYLIISLALILTGCGSGTGDSHGWAAMTALLWALSSMAAGAAVGFLFGIPKILQGIPRVSEPNGTLQAVSDLTYRQQVNTNLTEISDWLTKIIVGLGLINLKEIPPFIRSKAFILAESLKQADPTKDYLSFAVAVLVGFAILGFLFGYIFTRMYLASAFARADVEANQIAADAANGRIDSLNSSIAFLTAQVKQIELAIQFINRGKTDAKPPIHKSSAPENVEPTTRMANEPSKLVESGQQFSAALKRDMPVPKQLLVMHDEIRELAKKYNDVDSPSQAERVRLRNNIAVNMATIINQNKQYRDWAVKEALEQKNVGLMAGLAMAINAEPMAEDLKRLLTISHCIFYKHARYLVTTAIGRLFDARIATKGDIPQVLAILSVYYYQNSDSALQQRVRQTLAQISQSTGQNVTMLPN